MNIRTPQRVCLFCGLTLRLSNEHIIPRWLMDHLGIRDTTITPTVTETASSRIVDLRRHPVRAFVAGTVCGICNNGWMSRLEADVKPILIPLIDDPLRMEALGLRQRTTIARWAVKTAGVLNRASAFGSSGNEMSRPVPNDHLTDVMNGRLPSGVAVLGCGYRSSKSLDWLQFGTWMAPANSIPLREADRNRSYKIALAFRDLVLLVVYYPSDEYRYGVIEGNYFTMWAGDRHVIPIPRQLEDSLPHSSSPVLEGLLRNVFLMSKTWIELVGNMAATHFVMEP